MRALAFHGGTALRFLYGLPRYSEDLDFALEGRTAKYDLSAWLRETARQLLREGYDVRVKVKERSAVHAGWLRFRGLLYDLRLSPHRDQSLAIKVDVDTRPPAGATMRTQLVRRHVSLRIHHHDRASLLAGKLHAVLCRPWAKGRDLYDLGWYLSDPTWPGRNLALLNAALQQTGDSAGLLESTWRTAVLDRLVQLDWDDLIADVRPFLAPGDAMPAQNDVMELVARSRPPTRSPGWHGSAGE